MLRAYWDESGSERDPQCHFMGIAGLVASEEDWARFEGEWQRILAAYGLPYFHAKDCEHGRGLFEGREVWPRARRTALVEQLLAAIALARPRILGALVWLDAWRALPPEDRALFLGPWFPCMQECVRLAAVRATMDATECALIFSRQDELGGRARVLWDALQRSSVPGIERVREFRMEDMRQSPPLQAADLVAYEIVKSTAFLTSDAPLRPALLALFDIDPHTFIVNIDAHELAQQVAVARLALSRSEAAAADRSSTAARGRGAHQGMRSDESKGRDSV